jgi:Flp pilus assembly protein TadG
MTRSHERRDEGSLTLFTAIVAVALLLAAAFVADAGIKLDAAQQARGLAEQAARAGAGQVNQSAAYTGGGQFTTDPAQAITAAQAYLSHSGHTGSVTVAGNSIQVTVTVTEPAALTAVLGISSLTATETATAGLVQGVTGPQP